MAGVFKSMTRKIIVATSNSHKAAEIEEMLNLNGFEFLTLSDVGLKSDPEEDADTFEGNALIKARAAYNLVKQNNIDACVLADDSGICIDALNGEPGVFSARYAGINAGQDAINKKLFNKLEGVPFENRSARFVCSIAFIDENGNEICTTGTVEGRVGFEPIGDQGFGYDPIFYPEEFGFTKTFGEVSAEEKNKISHRSRSLELLKQKLDSK